MHVEPQDALTSPSFASAGLVHGFGTRDAMNSDTPPSGRQLRGDDQPVFAVHQVHGAACLSVGPTSEPARARQLPADALATRRKGCLLAVRTADCVPVLLHNADAGAVAAAHAGWRGLHTGVLANAISTMERTYSCQPLATEAVIGPCIGACCFEVGPEVAAHFVRLPEVSQAVGARLHLDLRRIARLLLVAAGLRPELIFDVARCTYCESERFFSYRRDGPNTGRQWSYVGLQG